MRCRLSKWSLSLRSSVSAAVRQVRHSHALLRLLPVFSLPHSLLRRQAQRLLALLLLPQRVQVEGAGGGGGDAGDEQGSLTPRERTEAT